MYLELVLSNLCYRGKPFFLYYTAYYCDSGWFHLMQDLILKQLAFAPHYQTMNSHLGNRASGNPTSNVFWTATHPNYFC
jgi:hypothetical protein